MQPVQPLADELSIDRRQDAGALVDIREEIWSMKNFVHTDPPWVLCGRCALDLELLALEVEDDLRQLRLVEHTVERR